MLSRIVALTLASILFWCGVATQEQVIALASASTAQAVGGQTDEWSQRGHDGSVDDHHLDDQPAPAYADATLDMPALITAVPDTVTPVIRVSRAWLRSAADWGLLYLDRPQRPPRVTPHTA